MHALLYHPLLIFSASLLAFTLTTQYTLRGSPWRYILLIFMSLCAYMFPHSIQSWSHTTGWLGRMAAGAVFWNIFTAFDKLILRGWDYYNYPPVAGDGASIATKVDLDPGTKDKDGKPPSHYPGTRSEFTNEVTGTARGIGLFWQVKNVPSFSRTQPTYVPSKSAFLLLNGTAMIACYFLQNLMVHVTLASDRSFRTSAHAPLFARLDEISWAELQTRVVVSLAFWIQQYCLLQFLYALFAIQGVVASGQDIKLWPPQFGPFEDACTIRGFWGKFWHQNLRCSMEGVTGWLAHDILRLPARGLLQRYTKLFVSFIMSGMMHVMSDMGGGTPARESGGLVFFPMQAVGIILEDLVQAAYLRLATPGRGRTLRAVEMAVGYAWVLAFLVWTSPVWVFPIRTNVRLEDDLLSLDLYALNHVTAGR